MKARSAPGAVEGSPELLAAGDPPAAQAAVDHRPGDLGRPPRRLRLRQASRREVPEALVALAPDDRDLAAEPEDVEHPAESLAVVPAARPPLHDRAILERAGRQRTAPAELAEDIAPERGVRCDPFPDVARAGAVTTRVATHRCAVDAVVGRGDDVRPVLVELPAVERGRELRHVEGPEPAEENHPLCPRDGRHRIDLHRAERTDDAADVGWCAAVEQLRRDGEPACLVQRELGHRRTVSSPITRLSRSSARSKASSRAVDRRTPGSRWKARTTSSPAARSDFRSARPTIRSRQRSGRT